MELRSEKQTIVTKQGEFRTQILAILRKGPEEELTDQQVIEALRSPSTASSSSGSTENNDRNSDPSST